jgi:hypothetical protein
MLLNTIVLSVTAVVIRATPTEKRGSDTEGRHIVFPRVGDEDGFP